MPQFCSPKSEGKKPAYPPQALGRIIHLCIALKASTATSVQQTPTDLPLKLAPGQHQETHNTAIAMSESHRG